MAHNHLRPFQAEALRSLRSPSIHLILTAPTGAGKGVVLEELARDPGERILLITPLIALARQQTRRFSGAGVRVHSSVGRGPGFDPGPGPENQVWILSPESVILPERTDRILRWKPTLIAIDEAHCLEEWGDFFRPAYSSLVTWIREVGAGRTLWMSATFPKSLAERLERQIPGPWERQGSFALPDTLTVRIERRPYAKRVEDVRKTVLEKSSPGILFVGTRRASENYARLLKDQHTALIPYHAGMSDEERRAIEGLLESTREGISSPSVVATNAFGMGMDFPQLEWALLAQAPLSLLALMQAVGRVGRSGRPGLAEIYWAEEDFRIAGFLVSSSANREAAELRLATLRHYLEGGSKARKRILRDTFV